MLSFKSAGLGGGVLDTLGDISSGTEKKKIRTAVSDLQVSNSVPGT